MQHVKASTSTMAHPLALSLTRLFLLQLLDYDDAETAPAERQGAVVGAVVVAHYVSSLSSSITGPASPTSSVASPALAQPETESL